MNSLAIGLLLLLFTGVVCASAWIGLRHRRYRCELKYNPRQDFALGVASGGVETFGVTCDSTGFVFPKLPASTASVCLELSLHASVSGSILDPSVEVSWGSFRDRQFFERGVHGLRFLNLTRLLKAGVKAGDRVVLTGSRLIWKTGATRLHACHESVGADDRVLIVAPHPDDAELAGFGLYADTQATIVTVTAGENSDRYPGESGGPRLTRAQIGRMRVLDSIMAPQIGGVPREHVLNLAYPDSRLSEMRRSPTVNFSEMDKDKLDFAGLRQLNVSPLLRDGGQCTWQSLVSDLAHVLKSMQPTIIVVADPWLDPHPDHAAATVAVCEALRETNQQDGRFFLTCVHNRWSELIPLGPAGSGVPMPPRRKSDAPEMEGFYSHPLSPERMTEKYLALEAMHDVRELSECPPQSLHSLRKKFRQIAGASMHGMGIPPTSLLRRAVRPDEIFWTISVSAAMRRSL